MLKKRCNAAEHLHPHGISDPNKQPEQHNDTWRYSSINISALKSNWSLDLRFHISSLQFFYILNTNVLVMFPKQLVRRLLAAP